MDFESKHERLAPLSVFLKRWAKYILLSAAMLGPALGLGVAGYHWIAGLGWTDSLLNASMILGGMGPVGELQTRGAKLFAAAYALFSGLLFIVLMGIVLAPLMHRMLHKFHLDEGDTSD
jgi:hypothetical protein